jgi:hypothetical protein
MESPIKIKEIISAFNLPEGVPEIRNFGNGLINSTWLLTYPKSKFILQKVNDAIFKHPEAIAANVRMIADFLEEKHPEYLFVKSIRTKNKNDLIHVKEGYFRVYPYVANSHSIDVVANPQQAYEASRKFGEFTKMLSGINVAKLQITLPDFHNLSLRFKQFTEVLRNGNLSRIQRSKELIDFTIANKSIVGIYEKILQNPSFKLRVTHQDTKISNVLFNNQDIGLCVIDLDTVMPGYFISDVGDMIRTYLSPASEEEKDFSKIEIRQEYFTAIWKGYMSEMEDELSKEEKDHFIYAGKFMIYMQAMRFLTDYLGNDIYYKTEFEEHNFVRARNQIMLLKKLIENEEVLKKIKNIK